MKQFKMPSKREFQAMYPPGNDAFDCAVRATLDALPENSPNRMRVKRKMSVGLAAAVILVLALTCAAVAAGLGVFGRLAEQTANKGYSELYRALDEKSVSMDETLNTGGQTFRLKQAYADENSLFVAYEMTNMRPVVDYTWMPTTEELAQMEQMDDVQPDKGNEERDAMIRKRREKRRGRRNLENCLFERRRISGRDGRISEYPFRRRNAARGWHDDRGKGAGTARKTEK